MHSFTGAWHTTFGLMDLVHTGRRVRGTYSIDGKECLVQGTVKGRHMTFTFQEGDVRGEGWFRLLGSGESFTGRYRDDGQEGWYYWQGTRAGFGGLWETTFGRLRLIEQGEQVRGFYEPGASLEGRRSGADLAFTYAEPRAAGRGRLTLTGGGLSFDGEWQAEGSSRWSPWTGVRIRPRPELTWLVVLEAPWQRHLGERDYSFGGMLGAFFARLSWVEVRHRFFANPESLQHYCREVLYLAEPVVLLLATHGLEDGIAVNGRTVGIPPLLESLRHVPDLRLLHFSACLLMKDPRLRGVLQTFSDQSGVPVSGYSTSVNWAASAILEFTYLELVLGRDYTPAEAAREVRRSLTFAGAKGRGDEAFPASGFRLVTPRR